MKRVNKTTFEYLVPDPDMPVRRIAADGCSVIQFIPQTPLYQVDTWDVEVDIDHFVYAMPEVNGVRLAPPVLSPFKFLQLVLPNEERGIYREQPITLTITCPPGVVDESYYDVKMVADSSNRKGLIIPLVIVRQFVTEVR